MNESNWGYLSVFDAWRRCSSVPQFAAEVGRICADSSMLGIACETRTPVCRSIRAQLLHLLWLLSHGFLIVRQC